MATLLNCVQMDFNKTYPCKVISDESPAAQQYANTLLHTAISNCTYKKVKRLLKSSIPPVDVNALDQNGFTPLYLAVEKGDLKSTEILLKHNANPNHSEHLPLVPAVKSNCPELVRVLLQYGADPNVNEEIMVFAVLHGDEKIVQTLLEHGADANVCYKEVTLLEFAIERHQSDININIVRSLLEHGARIVCTKNCLLSEITERGRTDVFELLINAGAARHVNAYSNCMYKLIQTNNVELMRLILVSGVNMFAPNNHKQKINFNSYLHHAAVKGNREIIDVLIKYGANVCETDLTDDSRLREAILKDDYETAYILLLIGCRASFREFFKGNTSWSLVSEDALYNVCLAFLMIGMNWNRENTHSSTWCNRNKKLGYITDVLARFLGLNCDSKDNIMEDVGSITNEEYRESLIKLRLAGLPLNFNQTKQFKTLELNSFGDTCTEEIKRMKKTILYDKVTLYDFLRATTRRLVMHMHNDQVEERLLEEFKSIKFENYKVFLWINYMRGIHYRPVYDIAYDNLFKACNHTLPYPVLENILNYLTIKDMYKLYKIYDWSNEKSQCEFFDVFSEINTSFFSC